MSNNKHLKYANKNYMTFNSVDSFSLVTKTVRYFEGINITLFLKYKHILKMCAIVCLDILSVKTRII